MEMKIASQLTALLVVAAGMAGAQTSAITKVRTVDKIVLHDVARRKDIPLKIYYPVGAGPFPVIVFSHGAWASKDSYFALGQYWASHGYVSIHPSHADSRKDSGFRGTLRATISDPQAWEDRPKDISFVLDSLSEVERKAPALRGKLDRTRIGVGGHSFGAYTAEAVAGATVQMPGRTQPQSFADKRVRLCRDVATGDRRNGTDRSFVGQHPSADVSDVRHAGLRHPAANAELAQPALLLLATRRQV